MTGTTATKTMAERGRIAAQTYLGRRGFEILEEAWECEAGTVDIIAKEDGEVVFVEVMTRESQDGCLPEEDATDGKRQRMECIAAHYLSKSDVIDCPLRFDVISLLVVASGKALLRHHRGAWSIGG